MYSRRSFKKKNMKINVISSMREADDKPPTTAWDHHDNRSHVTLRQLLRPSITIMKICGCYSFENGNKGGNSDGRIIEIFGKFFRLMCFLVAIASCAKAVAAFFTIPATFMQLNAINLIWLTQCLVIFLISYKASHVNYGSQTKAFDFWDEKIKPELDALGIDFPEEKIKKRQKICIVIATCFSIINLGCLVMFSVDVFSRGLDMFYAAPFAPSIPVLIVANCMMIEVTLLWIMPVFYIIVISSLLIETFDSFNVYFENHIKQNMTKMTCLCQRIRLLHLNLGKMVSILDNDFGYYLAATFVFGIGLSCFILFMVLRSQHDTLSLVMFIFWILSPMCLLAAVAIHAAKLNDSVSKWLASVLYLLIILLL